MSNYFEEKSSLMNGTYHLSFLWEKIKATITVIREGKTGEDESEKRNEINVELIIVEWGKQ